VTSLVKNVLAAVTVAAEAVTVVAVEVAVVAAVKRSAVASLALPAKTRACAPTKPWLSSLATRRKRNPPKPLQRLRYKRVRERRIPSS